MKYNEYNKPLICMQTTSTCYRKTYKMKPLGILWHSTGANNPTIRRYVQPSDNDPNKASLLKIIGVNKNGNDWNHKEVQAGLNAWIGKLADGTVTTIQSMPWDFRPWGCASGRFGSCNSGWIQFEICEDDLNDPVYFNKVYKEACELTAYLCKMYNLNPFGTVKYGKIDVPVILCHYDSYTLGLGNAHSDIYHWFRRYGKDMNTVRQDVYTIMNNQEEEDEDMTTEKFDQMMKEWLTNKAKEEAGWGKENLDWAKNNGIMQGDEAGRMMPNKFCTRLEVVTMLKRLAEKIGLK